MWFNQASGFKPFALAVSKMVKISIPPKNEQRDRTN